jgi:hypothetical protein
MAKTTTIAGNTFLFTGKLTEFTREDAEAHVEAEGGKVLSGVSAKLNYLVVGEDAGSKLAKAEALGTVTILHEKEFLKMMPNAGNNNKTTAKDTSSSKVTLFRNELIFNGKYADLLKIIKKHGGKETYKDGGNKVSLIKKYDSDIAYGDLIDNDTVELFHLSEATKKLIINRIVSSFDAGEEFLVTEEFLNDISKLVEGEFKLSVLNRNNWTLIFYGNVNGKIEYYETSLSEWEDPYYFEEEPYFVKLAKQKGVKMKKDEDGEKMYDSDEIYDIIYEFRDSLISWPDTYLEIAPEWYLKMKSIKH